MLLTSHGTAADHHRIDEIERLLADDLTTAGKKQSQADAPANADQLALITERCRRESALSGAEFGHAFASDLSVTKAMEMMDMEILIPFSLGVPKHRQLQAGDFLNRHTADTPSRLERLARVVETVFATECQVQRGLAFGARSGG